MFSKFYNYNERDDNIYIVVKVPLAVEALSWLNLRVSSGYSLMKINRHCSYDVNSYSDIRYNSCVQNLIFTSF